MAKKKPDNSKSKATKNVKKLTVKDLGRLQGGRAAAEDGVAQKDANYEGIVANRCQT